MTNVFYEIREPYSAEQMFDLVNDINAYPQFIPDCASAGILKQQDDLILAYLEVEKLGFKKKFITTNKLTKPYRIEMALVDGPFKQLQGDWTFTELSEHECKISFALKFEFKSKLLDLTFTPLFKELMENMVKAFSKRAKQIYTK
ncbi:ribosome-associated toxin RatA of RatAB toxin-antitoxin module [Orbus hercynius]|uniref:Ribosome-associated toxin RatA of RatAB toxin-antitoxin module n=1 Tax=Orbus hercynius TaxID=593135 RepID=A0A495RH70_9GAMM|nr:type II toxin-antitoxin system RatA family toxin [Orbus hercynius]RKS86873.1 ribosome-associated toxin RatA of RatAB toxin-antitoxin module [Orbus hercynius]